MNVFLLDTYKTRNEWNLRVFSLVVVVEVVEVVVSVVPPDVHQLQVVAHSILTVGQSEQPLAPAVM